MAGRDLADSRRGPRGPRRRLPIRLALGAAALAAVALVWATLPERPLVLPPPAWVAPHPLVRGALHIHSTLSDGSGTIDDIAAAAARAGLAFIIATDHGDGTREPAPPAYRAGVLCLDGVEISSCQGHYLAVGMRQSPYPLGGEARDVVEDVARLGGFGIVAHPGSQARGAGWTAWDAPFDAMEWLNADTEWRDESWPGLAWSALAYPFRGPAAMAAVFDRPVQVLSRFDELAQQRPVVALAGADAHARFGIAGARDPYRGWLLSGVPSYEVSFRAFSVRVELDEPPSGIAADDADRLIAALRAGHVYTAIDGVAGPAVLDFAATSGPSTARSGDRLLPDGPVDLQARVNAPPGASITLFANGRPLVRVTGSTLTRRLSPEPAAYRVEVDLPRAPGTPPVPWILSNPIYVGPIRDATPSGSDARAPGVSLPILDAGGAPGWHIEHDPTSAGAVGPADLLGSGERSWTYQLGPGQPAGQFVAMVRPFRFPAAAAFDRLSLRAHSSEPMRLSVQLRVPDGRDGQRWLRSVYLDETPREISVFFDDLRPIGQTDTRRADRGRVDSLLFVVDTTHARPGTAGEVWLRELRLEGPGPGAVSQVLTVSSR